MVRIRCRAQAGRQLSEGHVAAAGERGGVKVGVGQGYLRERARTQIEARHMEALNRAADELASEIEDVLRDQAELGDPRTALALDEVL